MRSVPVSECEAIKRERLIGEIMSADGPLLQYIRNGNFDQWMSIEVTMPQLKTLVLTYGAPEGRMRMGQIAQALGVAMSTATGIVERLVEQGFLLREMDPEDRRSVAVRLTSLGRETLDRPHMVSMNRLARVLMRLTTSQLEAAAEALGVILQATHEELVQNDGQKGPDAGAEKAAASEGVGDNR